MIEKNKTIDMCDECLECECYWQNNDSDINCQGSVEKCHEYREKREGNK